jgi:glutaminase
MAHRSRTPRKSNAQQTPFLSTLEEIFHSCRAITDGELADYIPELTKVNPDLFAAVVMTVDGKMYQLGDYDTEFTIQSISKAFVYALALADQGVETVLKKVGVKPSSDAFNSILFDDAYNRPFNPMVNAGAIVTTSLVKGNSLDERYHRILNMFQMLSGREMHMDRDVYLSEKRTGNRNRAIGYLELSAGMIDEPVDEHLDLYFRQCSILTTATDLAVMAATLANNGINPTTFVKAFDPTQVTQIFSVMTSCGMYDYSGDWLFRVGIPAKSGVGGGIIAILPNQFGIGVFSPKLDTYGNSVRGIKFCEELSSRFNLHLFHINRQIDVTIYRSYTASIVSSKRQRRIREKEYLEEKGDDTIILEVRGDLHFGTMERLIRNIMALSSLRFIILDMTKIGRFDEIAMKLFLKLEAYLLLIKVSFFVVGLKEETKLSLSHLGWTNKSVFYPNVDLALQQCEDTILSEAPFPVNQSQTLQLNEMDMFRTFSDDEVTLISKFIEIKEYAPGAYIIEQGDDADSFYFLAKGIATVSLRNMQAGTRLTSYIPGVTFGELILFEDDGKRTADIKADSHVICYVMTKKKLDELFAQYPTIYAKILQIAGRSLASTLRRVTAQLHSIVG